MNSFAQNPIQPYPYQSQQIPPNTQVQNQPIFSIPQESLPENATPQIKVDKPTNVVSPTPVPTSQNFNYYNKNVNSSNTNSLPLKTQYVAGADTSDKPLEINKINYTPIQYESNKSELEGHELKNQTQNKEIIETKDAIQEQTEKITEIAVQQELYALDSVDIFGFKYFRDKKINLYNSAQDVRPSEDYILGVGDQINVAIWGYADYNEVFTIEKDGYIQPKYVGRIYLKGLTLANAREVIKARYSRAYMIENSQFDIALNYSRVIAVNIVGEVEFPGTYTIPAINTLFNLMAYTGGPTKYGSLRNIQIKRNGEVVRTFDLYKFLTKPDVHDDYFIQNNDYIYVPVAKKVVTILGQIVRPFRYEMLENETLEDLLFYAGGLLPTAQTNSIQVKRTIDNKTFILDVDYQDLKKSKGTFKLQNGDVITVRRISAEIENFVTIDGAVWLPGKFQFIQGERISDLIDKAQGLRENAYMNEAYLTRVNADNTKSTYKVVLSDIVNNYNSKENLYLKPKDELKILNLNMFLDAYAIKISGAVRNPNTFSFIDNMTLKDLIILSEGLEKYAYLERAYISRKDPKDNSYRYIAISLDTSNNYGNLDTIKMQPRDEVQILSNFDFLFDNKVKIEGAVQNPGFYELWKELTLKDLIYIAGGFAENVFANKIIIQRTNSDLTKESISIDSDTSNYLANLDNIKLQRNDVVRIFSRDIFIQEFEIQVKGLVKKPGQFKFSENLSLADAILLAGGFKLEAASNRVEIASVANFLDAAKQSDSTKIKIDILNISKDFLTDALANDYKLNPNDIVYVRSIPNFDLQKMVQVNGEVMYPGEYVLASKGDRILDIINRSGGLTKDSYAKGASLRRTQDNVGIVVIDLEKAMRRKTSKYNITLKPGDVLSIPEVTDIITLTGQIDYPYEQTGMLRPVHLTDSMTVNEYIAATPDKTISCNYEPGHSARYFIKKYGAGFGKYGKKKDTYVIQPNGHIQGLKYALLARKFPKVEAGATIVLPRDEYKPRRSKGKKDGTGTKINDIVKETLASLTGILTFYLLIKRVF
jgi:protein involved in polysaccharide export with SLBB domain